MLSSPVRRGTPSLAFCIGLVLGGIASAVVSVVAGSLVRAPLPAWLRWLLVAAVLVVVWLRDRGVLRVTLPENRRLVPESVLRLGRHLGPLQFGLEMGTGARTFMTSGLPYAAVAAVMLIASFPAALCAGAGFGVGRALMTMSNLRYGPDNMWSDEWDRHGRWLGVLMASGFVAALGVLAASTLL